jgi:hypothetical protein
MSIIIMIMSIDQEEGEGVGWWPREGYTNK